MNTIVSALIGGIALMFIILLISVALGFLIIKINIDRALINSRFVTWINEKLKEKPRGRRNTQSRIPDRK